MNKICAVVVTYNRLDMLKGCISSIRGQTSACDIMIVNNNSEDGTTEYLNSQDDIIHIHMDRNTGGAGGFNAGMREAVIRGYDYIWMMDDDTFPYSNALEMLIDADRILEGNYGWLCSVPLWKDGKECIMNRPKLLKAFYEDIHLLQYGLIRAEHATFVSLFVKSGIVRQYGLPIKEFFIWGDDIEYTRRLAVRRKLPCFVVGQSVIVHAMQNNTGSSVALDSLDRLNRYNLAFRNENYLYRQEGIRGFCYYLTKRGRDLLFVITKSKNHRILRSCIILKQLLRGLFFNPKIEYISKL